MAASTPTPDGDFIASTRDRIETALAARLPESSPLGARLVEAMRYAVLGSGKRLRPLLVCATTQSLLGGGVSAGEDPALDPACAIEFIHAYSLIHDDLPAMDNDTLRRGRPTCHLAFDEATAILAGDALQTLAFETLARSETTPQGRRLEMVAVLAGACGWQGMVGGQARDIDTTGKSLSVPELQAMHEAKTGALLRAAVQLGALAARADDEHMQRLSRFGTRIGLAFQIVDDLLDATASTEQLGKTAGADAAQGKNTYPGLMGLAGAREAATGLAAEARRELAALGLEHSPLAELAELIIDRRH